MHRRLTPLHALFLALITLGALRAQTPVNPILFVTQVPHTQDFAVASVFGNHLPAPSAAPRGGDLWIRYPDGSVKNLTATAGFGVASGFQGTNGIAVRDPSMHWDGRKAIFSMVVGGSSVRYQHPVSDVWQLYEVTGLGANETPVITRVPNQPANYNNVSPCYATDDRIIFTTDRPHNGQAHLYPQRDEYEESPTNTGLWSLNPVNGNLFLMQHMPSGSFTPIVDSFGRVLYTRWDHLLRDQQADNDRATALATGPNSTTFGTFNYSSESASATYAFGVRDEVFPESRLPEGNVEGLAFNFFFPWMIQENGEEEETLNHLGRHELLNYFARSFTDDPNVDYFFNPGVAANPNRINSCLQMKEDPLVPGRYIATDAQEFGTHAAGRLFAFNAAPSINPEDTVINYLTVPASTNPAQNTTGHFRDPLPLSNGGLVAIHTADAREDVRNAPSIYTFRLRQLTLTNGVWTPGPFLTSGTSKTLWWWSPDERIDFSGALWELQPVEVRARPRPERRCADLPDIESAVFAQAGVPIAAMKRWLRTNNLALMVVRDATTRDRADEQQPYNLRVPGGVQSIGSTGKIYDVTHLQIFQADLVRGLGLRKPTDTPYPGRRVLAQPLHDTVAELPATIGPAGSVKLALDGSAAAFVPARRALSWQLTDAAGVPVVRERFWITFQSGEVRSCTSCHGVNTRDQANKTVPTNTPQALVELLATWKTKHPTEPLTDPYEVWAAGLADKALAADADGNGRSNLLDYALPDEPAVSQVTVGGIARWNFGFSLPATATDTNYVVQASRDLKTWSEIARFGPEGDSVTPTLATQLSRTTSNGADTILLSPVQPATEAPTQFFRIKLKRY
ncbi:hypothetical protein [Oleiharenicola lentus]|uniref:HzsA-related protein n=1 Tax=Oleiharenicola lentus TaxID=2508720 RepID=UPI003F665F91